MVLVLLVVPALLAMQQDLSRQLGALRRALRMRRGGRTVGFATLLAGVPVAALFALTLGWVILTGALPAPLMAYLPAGWTGALPDPVLALAVFLAGSAALVLTIFAGAAGLMTLLAWRRHKDAQAAP
jgi:hypothetical protein